MPAEWRNKGFASLFLKAAGSRGSALVALRRGRNSLSFKRISGVNFRTVRRTVRKEGRFERKSAPAMALLAKQRMKLNFDDLFLCVVYRGLNSYKKIISEGNFHNLIGVFRRKADHSNE